MKDIRLVYECIQPRFDPQGFALLHAAEEILGKKVENEAFVNATGFDKLTVLLKENIDTLGGNAIVGIPLICSIKNDSPEFQEFLNKLYPKAIRLLNKKFLYIIQNANNQLRIARVGKHEHTYTKSHPLTQSEAITAMEFGLRVDAISEKEDYHGTLANGFTKERMTLKTAKLFYDNKGVDYPSREAVLYLSPDYGTAKCIMDDIMYAIHYFIDKQDALRWAGIEECPTYYITVGMPGCGKSTLSAKLDAEVYSSDSIRKEFTGDVSGETKGAVEFYVMNLRTQQALRAGLDTISDATSLSKKARYAAMKNVAGIPHKTVCLFFNCLREDSDRRNLNPDRDKNVPVEALERLWNNLEIPTLDEGFNEIYDIIVLD